MTEVSSPPEYAKTQLLIIESVEKVSVYFEAQSVTDPSRIAMNRYQFEQHARHFRSGSISLQQLSDLVFAGVNKAEPPVEILEAVEVIESADFVASAAEEPPEEMAYDISLPSIKIRPTDAHKGDFGRVLAIGGSRGMGGSIALTSMAAMRSGSGLVTAAIPESIAETVAGFDPCLMTLPCRDSNGHFSSVPTKLKEMLPTVDAIAIGPGMGREVDRYFLEAVLGTDLPVVMDADAINVFADAHLSVSKRNAATVLTPHPGEFSNLTNHEYADRTEMESAAVAYAKEHSCVMVLKGSQTLVTDGTKRYANQSGNVGMATAGSGDVLTGVIASLLGQGYAAFEAAVLGVHLHGRAGDVAAQEFGTVGLVATDILNAIAEAIHLHSEG